MIEVRVIEAPIWDFGRRVTFDMSGEAVAVDLADGKTLFALTAKPMDGDYAVHVPLKAFLEELNRPTREAGGGSPDYKAWIDRLQRQRASAVLGPSDYPLMVVFADPAKPSSVRQLDASDLGAYFGDGVKLRRITIQIVEDPVTRSISTRLPWLSKYRRNHWKVDGKPYEPTRFNDLKGAVGPGNFSTEI
ncbi:hypothetical protein [Sphingosinicella sp. BN140058]|uniref:hypothetical protein n=1 Tax=Sphingosinicella sp. BN140058 TaxID=1892855 RepID=UPI001010B14E|nr:hypothetical protein [Sphingosinicella sp. BN140058]QAY75404.1 hypothetical protein ETR14_01825 [Sphingosinicella sp. BN140058]